MPILMELTDREKSVLQLLAQGLTNKHIAAALGIAPSTVQNHLRWIYAKLDAACRVDAARTYWREAGLLGEPQVSNDDEKEH